MAYISEKDWQAQVTFPDWKGYTDDTLAMNCMCSFYFCHGQGKIMVCPSREVTGFDLYVNGHKVDTDGCRGGDNFEADITPFTLNGINTLQVSNISPDAETAKVTVFIPYPEVLEGSPEEEGIRPEAMELIDDIISTDVEFGFPAAQLAVIRNGRLVCSRAWGKTNAYLPDGSINDRASDVTEDTLFDLASVTKMFSVNYAFQKFVTDEKVDLDEKITRFLGDEFVTETMDPADAGFAGAPSTDKVREWKAGLAIRDLLRHQGGFPENPRYYAPYLLTGSEPENPLYAGNGADEETKNSTIRAICRTPLIYEPGTKTVYSDVDYVVLGLIAEQIAGTDLDTYLKQTFFEPIGLDRITYNPLRNGFTSDECAATELNGNTRDGLYDWPGLRTGTLKGQVHDETAYYNMAGISGNAGLFSNARDLAKLAFVMMSGGYGQSRFFSENVMDLFTAPKSADAGSWGLGWWRQGDGQRVWYFGTQAGADTIGHQGWTGTMVMIDRGRQLVIVYLTNKINSPVTDNKTDANQFDGNRYTAGTLGFVPQILSLGMDSQTDISGQLLDLVKEMVTGARKLADKKGGGIEGHPAMKNLQSKIRVLEKIKKRNGNLQEA